MRFRLLAAFSAVFTIVACGGGGGSSEPATDARASTTSLITLQSDSGDYVGEGKSYSYDQANAVLTVTESGGLLRVSVAGNQTWDATFQVPNALSRVQVGSYQNVQRTFNDAVAGGMDWGGNGRGCNTLHASFTVNSVSFTADKLTAVDLSFEQHCEGAAAALRGRVVWHANDPTRPAGPVQPVPASLWQPATGATPATGNFVYFESDPGDYLGRGRTLSYTQTNATISVNVSGGLLHVQVNGDDKWTGDFQAMNTLVQLQRGYYGGLRRYDGLYNRVLGGLDWYGPGGCNELSGWFAIDDIQFSGTTLTSIDLRFEQHCELAAPSLRGQIHWVASDGTQPPGPLNPPPAGLWRSAIGATPNTGNYVFLASETGEFIGAGRTFTYTQADATITVNQEGGRLTVRVTGDQQWSGEFQAMNTLSRLETGYYGGLLGVGIHNPTAGGLSWSGDGRACNTLTAWFVVDSVSYSGTNLAAIDLRFEQRCDGIAQALHGRIRWAAGDTTLPPGPRNPPPSNLWAPATGATPSSGNYVYLQSDAGDAAGGGRTNTFTQADSAISVSIAGSHLSIDINGDERWFGEVEGLKSTARLERGYYPGVLRYPFNNPTKGGISWIGGQNGCNAVTGWFVIDSISYSGESLLSIDLRFEQHCEGLAPALRGQIHWRATDTTKPPGPQVPPPNDLWVPPTGATPSTGNYIYLSSDSGDFVGQGLSAIYTPGNATVSVTGLGGRADVSVNGPAGWTGRFEAMNSLTELKPGYYAGLKGFPQNPAKGGLGWSGGRGCNTATGWFVVDNVRYANGALAGIDLRFEQRCDGSSAGLRGKIHWLN